MTLNPKYLRGCVLAFDFAELSGSTVYDLSGHGNHGTIYGASWRKGPLIGSLYFDGEDDYVELPNVDVIKPDFFTAEIMFKWRGYGTGTWQCIYDSHDGVHGHDLTLLPSDVLYFEIKDVDGNNHRIYYGEIDDKWHLVHCMFDESYTMYFYFDGELFNSKSVGKPCSKTSFAPRIASTGRPSPGLFFPGFIAFVRIYNRALSLKEIREHYYYVKNMVSKPRFPIFYKHRRTKFVPALA